MKLAISLLLLFLATAHAEPVRLIFDTDMANDCDDAGALAVRHALADLGEVEILAIVRIKGNPRTLEEVLGELLVAPPAARNKPRQ